MNIRLNTIFVEQLNDSSRLKHFAVYMKMKSLYKNSCVYRFSYQKLSIASGISVNVIKSSMKFFKENGWVRIHHGNLVFEKISKVDDSGKGKIFLEINLVKDETYLDLVKRLRLFIVANQKRKFDYVKDICKKAGEYTLEMNYNVLKRAKRSYRKIVTKEVPENQAFTMSNTKIGKLFGISKTAASKLMNWGLKKGVCVLRYRYVIGSQKIIDTIKAIRSDNGLFWSKKERQYILQRSNEILFN